MKGRRRAPRPKKNSLIASWENLNANHMDILGVPDLWLRGHLKQPTLIDSLEIYGAVPQQLLAGLVARLVNSGLLSGCNYWYAQVWWSRTHLERELGKLSSSRLLFRSDRNNWMHHFYTSGAQLGIWLQVNWLVNLVIIRFKGIPSPVNAVPRMQPLKNLREFHVVIRPFFGGALPGWAPRQCLTYIPSCSTPGSHNPLRTLQVF